MAVVSVAAVSVAAAAAAAAVCRMECNDASDGGGSRGTILAQRSFRAHQTHRTRCGSTCSWPAARRRSGPRPAPQEPSALGGMLRHVPPAFPKRSKTWFWIRRSAWRSASWLAEQAKADHPDSAIMAPWHSAANPNALVVTGRSTKEGWRWHLSGASSTRRCYRLARSETSRRINEFQLTIDKLNIK